jgi:multidrug resistance efflux pump
MRDFSHELEEFMKEHTHLTVADVSLEFDPHEYEITLEAAGKSHAQYEKEMVQYKKEMKAYKLWQIERADDIIAFKEAEKKRIAKAKLQRTQDRLNKELAAVEAKLERA